jgi:hypothetical protein
VDLCYHISIDLPERENGSVFLIDGWIFARRPISTVRFETALQNVSLPVGSVSRLDVFSNYFNSLVYPCGAILHCGFRREYTCKEAPFKKGDTLSISVVLDNGQRIVIESTLQIQDKNTDVHRF